MLEQFIKSCSLWEGLTLEKFMENSFPWEGLLDETGEESEEEGAAETTCDELTTTPIPCPPVLLSGKEVENSGVKLSPGRRGGVKVFFKIWFYFSLSYSNLIGN